MIAIDGNNRVFTLHTQNTTYQMKADRYQVLLHTYYGPRIQEGDLSYLIGYADRGFSPNPDEAGDNRAYSLDTLPQEYSTCGAGDFRLPSIEFESENGSRMADLRYVGFTLRRGKYALEGLPAFWGGDEWETLVITMEDAAAKMQVELYYGVLEKYDLITRSVRVVNRGTETVSLRRCASLCLDFQGGDFDFITFDGCHSLERNLNRTPLRPGVQSVESVRGTSSHHHNPFVMLCEHRADEDYGLCYGAALVYSGSFLAAAERTQLEHNRLIMGLNPDRFCWTLAPGEAFTAPEAALVCSPCGFGQMSRQFHRAIRENLIHDPCQGRRRPILINNWEATEFHFDEEKLVSIARSAAPLGIDLFVMDDGWFGKRDSDTKGLGDWFVNEQKLPGGLNHLANRIKELGMSFGIWIEPEMVSEDSELYRAHPDWALGAPGRPQSRGRCQLVLDFSRQEVRDCIYESIKKVLDSADISYVKWDMNRSLTNVFSAALLGTRQGETLHRYVLGVYEMLHRMRRDYPHMLIEGCSGGGGRFDLGMLYYTPQIWCSDNTDAIDRLSIQYGTSFCYPVSAMGAHVSAVPNAQTGRSVSLTTRGVVAMSGTFGYEMDLNETTQEEKQMIREQVAFFKEHYDLIQNGDYYRLTPPGGSFTAWEQVSQDKREALISVVYGPAHSSPPFRILRLKGLDSRAHYQIGGQGVYSGEALMNGGWLLPLPFGEYPALQLYLRAV